MIVGMNCFVFDKYGHLLDKHTFWSLDEKVLRAAVDAFITAISIYNKDYKAMRTPLIYNFEED